MSEELKQGWSGIDSAPSGKAVLIYYTNRCGNGRHIRAMKIDRFSMESSADCEEGVAEYDAQNDRYTYVPGWWELIDNWDDFGFVMVNEGVPTHWMPLPPPPAKDQE